jgi:hypothetical protein
VDFIQAGYTPPPPKGAQAAVQELLLSIFQGNHLIISREIPTSDYSDISRWGRHSGGSGTCIVDFPEKPSDYFQRDLGFRLFRYIFIEGAAVAGRTPGSVDYYYYSIPGRGSTTRYTPPPPKGAPAAVQELVLLDTSGKSQLSII